MKDLIIISAGDFARETAWLVERINQNKREWNLLGFVDDHKAGKIVDGYPVFGTTDWLCTYEKDVFVTCAIGNGSVRKKIWDKLSDYKNLKPATLVDPAAVIGKDCVIGAGSIICAGAVLAVASQIGFNCIVNLNCTIGHDAVLERYCTIHPGTNISGRVHIGMCTDVGTGSKVIPGKQITSGITIGAGAVVTKDLMDPGVYIGIPAKKIH